MSFSSEVREELSGALSGARHCQTAYLAAILTMCGRVVLSVSDRVGIRIRTENLQVVRACAALMRRGFGVPSGIRATAGERKVAMDSRIRSRIVTNRIRGVRFSRVRWAE